MTGRMRSLDDRVTDVVDGLRTVAPLIGSTMPEGPEKEAADRLVNNTMTTLGTLFVPEAKKDILGNPKSWKRIQSGIAYYVRYFQYLMKKDPDKSAANVGDELAQAALEALHHNPPDEETELILRHPLLGIMVTHLSRAAENKDQSRFKRQYGGWFFDAQENLHDAKKALVALRERWEKRITTMVDNGDEQRLMRSFISDFTADAGAVLLSFTNIGCTLAMHAQEEDCAVYTPLTSFHVAEADIDRVREEIAALVELPIYQKHTDSVRDAGVHKNLARVPTYISVVDLVECTRFLADYLTDLARGMIKVQVHKQRTDDHQARIKLVPKNKRKFGDFHIRIDFDHHSTIAMDIGGVGLPAAMRYARQLGEDSKEHEMVMGYSSIVDDYGSIRHVADPRVTGLQTDTRRYVSVMLSTLEPEEKTALIVAGALGGSHNLVFPQHQAFTYHLQGNLNQREYKRQFKTIAGLAERVMK